ncbi:MAG: HEAT repeat domain-containing protein [Gemmatimonadota bacterium]|nr:HEAT repeat domain-containing protein [Gemmatimonadota bacterium]
MTSSATRHVAFATLLAFMVTPVSAQSLASRVQAAPDGLVQFTYAARAGVCGDGRSFISTGTGTWHGSFNEATRREPCEPGPVRVVINRADRAPIAIDAYVGPATLAPSAADLGTVSAREASEYLLSLARSLDGRPGRDAIFPAMLADSTDTAPALLAIAGDQSRPRETRRSAISWLGRVSDDQGPAAARRVGEDLVRIARDGSDNQQVRSQAVSVLARLDRGDGVPALIELSRSASDPWLGKQAMSALARSGDPRAREYLRTAAQRTDLPDDVLVSAIRGIGREYATAQDAEFLRGLYPRLASESGKDAILAALGEMGGTENQRWLVGVAGRAAEPMKLRRRALSSAEKAGAPIAELVSLYDAAREAEMKDALISLYARNGERVATDKLLAIAKSEEDRTIRRRTISRLSKSEDPRVKQVLQDIVERP